MFTMFTPPARNGSDCLKRRSRQNEPLNGNDESEKSNLAAPNQQPKCIFMEYNICSAICAQIWPSMAHSIAPTKLMPIEP